MSDKIVVLITGANRGIGNALLSTYLARPNHIVIAGLRDPGSVSSEKIQMLTHGTESKVVVLKLDSTSESDAKAAVETLKSKHNLTKLDIVIANAGISKYFGKAMVTPAKEMFDHFAVNTVAPLLLFQATAPLLQAAPAPKFVVVSSGAGSLSQVVKLPVENTAYGASKAAVNFVCRRIHYENPYLTVFALNPGWLQTDLGNHAARGAGMAAAPVPIQDGVNGMIEQIDKATREEFSGKFLSFNGEEIPW
ncbi:uncharacterized protein PV07_10088 [Cladophialophora immunda]|uniref:Uncharacterized protein n=1 Tax=Cladophialophora immunda TaxID=569365 RepID=A0A0D2C1M4_9EURO|nr:uncharacterized protein PV07_10088 [Cladophialophora immunda]KIW24370.1 hypothetical protein PV07_10088 [Cladophialophora immunda]OQU97940.1 hypothetical protein CLAIMM_03795 [Cladophialophora immunda]